MTWDPIDSARAFLGVAQDPKGAFSALEYRQRYSLSRTTAESELKALVKLGNLERFWGRKRFGPQLRCMWLYRPVEVRHADSRSGHSKTV